MPFLSGALNLGWEIIAVFIAYGRWGTIGWLVLDCCIFVYNFTAFRNIKCSLFGEMLYYLEQLKENNGGVVRLSMAKIDRWLAILLEIE